MSRSVEIGPGTTAIEQGWQVTLKPDKPVENIIPGSTAKHEAIHAVAGLLSGSGVEFASRIPGPGYRGKTILGGFNALAAIAPYAFGCSGTGHDVAMVSAHGYSPGFLAEAARELLKGYEEEILGVAVLIESKGTITGSQAKEVMHALSHPRAELEVKDPLGDVRQFSLVYGRNQRVYISVEKYGQVFV